TGCARRGNGDPSALHYTLPTRLIVQAGSHLPGTAIQYLGESEKGAHVLIEGQEAVKRVGDSLNWRGEPLSGAEISLALRVLSYNAESLQLIGTAEVDVSGAQPRAAPMVKTAPITHNGLVAYRVSKGHTVPGSTIVYEGSSEEGARLGGIAGYPFRKSGDSIVWEGLLLDGLYLSLELRLVQYDEQSMNVAGVVTFWFGV
ncbi:MAG TPA: hypothetical protein VM366_17785, partial [Anaerolineae bacterium]|nr:hypothetical protein [Anaerolineae bacterium]